MKLFSCSQIHKKWKFFIFFTVSTTINKIKNNERENFHIFIYYCTQLIILTFFGLSLCLSTYFRPYYSIFFLYYYLLLWENEKRKKIKHKISIQMKRRKTKCARNLLRKLVMKNDNEIRPRGNQRNHGVNVH